MDFGPQRGFQPGDDDPELVIEILTGRGEGDLARGPFQEALLTSSSRRRMLRLSVGWDTFIRFAARVKCFSSAKARNPRK